VWPRERLAEAQRVLAGVAGVTVLVHDQECAAEKRRKRKRGTLPTPVQKVLINERVCEGCGDCGRKSNCLSVQPVETEFGRKTRIHQASCNVDYSCLAGDCPSFMTVVPGAAPARLAVPPLPGTGLAEPESAVRGDGFAMRLMGVGGTGVVTVSQILATAAVLSGHHVRGLDQTGIAQKGGAVVSDLKISDAPRDLAGRVADRECDLYLGADLLVAADPKNLAGVDPTETVAVVSTSQVPTGSMVIDPGVSFPDPDGVSRRISAAVRSATYLDALGLAEQLFGDDQCANMLLVGAAFQLGALPLDAAAIERAIELNGAAVATNVQAFRRGRQAVADPAGLAAALAPPAVERRAAAAATAPGDPATAQLLAGVRAEPGSELTRIVAIRVPDLVAYQHASYASRYVVDVERVRAAEAVTVPGSTSLAETVARNLYKLMAYKDEYEVARLALDPALAAEVEARFGAGARAAWRLHPPVLRALGLQRKISLGRWFTPAFRLLRAMRRLRGTALDPFGYAHVRRVERELVTEYRAVVAALLSGLTAENHAMSVEIAGLPDLVRGYEQIKLDSVGRYRERLAELTRIPARPR
jgi:indolepyruvate ferredoxin oxidoreductase